MWGEAAATTITDLRRTVTAWALAPPRHYRDSNPVMSPDGLDYLASAGNQMPQSYLATRIGADQVAPERMFSY